MDNATNVGTVVWFSKGIGFIKPDVEGANDVFIHYSDVEMDGYKLLKKGQRVSYQIGLNHRGQNKAIQVKVID